MRPRDARGERGERWVVAVTIAALAAIAFVSSLVVQLEWLPHLSKNNDDAVYLFQAELYRDGNATLPVSDVGRSFRPWMSGVIGDRQAMVFPPGWPAVLALGTTLLPYRVTVALCAAASALAVYALAREMLESRAAAAAATFVVALSPLYVVLGATVLTYIPALGLTCATGALTLRAIRARRLRLLVAAGAALGVLFAMRPLDAVLTGGVFGAYGVWRLRSAGLSVPRAVGASLAGATPFVAAVLLYNRHVTGSALRFPLHANGGENGLGFGARRISAESPWFDVTPRMLWHATMHNLHDYPLWVFGGVLTLPLVVVGAWRLWLRRRDLALLLAAIVVAWPAAHFFYWGTYFVSAGIRDFGPFYYVPLLVPVAVLATEAVTWIARRAAAAPSTALVVGVALTLGVFLPPPLTRARAHTDAAERETDMVDALPAKSVVVLPESADGPWVMHVRGYFRNDPDLDGRTLYAANAGSEDLAIFDRFPDRRVYLLWGMVPRGEIGNRPRPRLDELRRVSGPRVRVRQTFTNPTENPVVVAYVSTPDGLARCVIDRSSSIDQRYELTWAIEPDRTVAMSGCVEPLPEVFPIDTVRGFLSIGFAAGPTIDSGLELYEYFTSMRTVSRPAGSPVVEVLMPPVQRRQVPYEPGVRLGRFNGEVEHVLQIDVTAE